MKWTPIVDVLVVLDGHNPLTPGERFSMSTDLTSVHVGRGTGPRFERRGSRLCVNVADSRVSNTHFRIGRRANRWVLDDLNSKNGTYVDGTRITGPYVLGGHEIILASTCAFAFRPHSETAPWDDLHATEAQQKGWGAQTLLPNLRAELRLLGRVARERLPILILGESGTGKERCARYLHERSGRKGMFVAVNCGAIAPSLIESELFGYKKGAFSGATADREGLVRAANGGTLFLDEIGELPLGAQVKLLRVLQEREVRPVGAVRSIPIELNVLAATHRDLEKDVVAGRFRQDLLARLDGESVTLPPLRERREDIGVLIANILPAIKPEGVREVTFSHSAVRTLLGYDWPTNIRGLEQVLKGAVARSVNLFVRTGNASSGVAASRALDIVIHDDHLPAKVRNRGPRPLKAVGSVVDKTVLDALLRRHLGNVSAVSRELGVARAYVYERMREEGIDLAAYRSTAVPRDD